MDIRKLRIPFFCLLIAAVTVALAVMLHSDREANRSKAEAAAALEVAQRPYLAELTNLYMELAQLDKNHEENVTFNTAAAHFLFTEPDARILTEALPLMLPYDYIGMVAVSAAFFPGNNGCLTVADLKQLTDDGWGICLSAETTDQIEPLYQQLQASGLPAPQAVYFPNGNGDLSAEEVIRSLGIPAVIQYGGSRPTDAAAGSLWYLEARGTFDSENNNAFLRALSDRTSMVLTEGWQLNREMFSREDFQANLDFFTEYVNSGEITISSIAAACERRQEASESHTANEQAWQTRRTELIQRQREIEEKLRDLSEQLTNP